LSVPDVEDFQSLAGRGVRGRVEGVMVLVGRREWIESEIGLPVPNEAARWIEADERRSFTPVFAAVDGEHAGVLALADQPRDRVKATLCALRSNGIEKMVLLTGDAEGTARAIGEAVGIHDVRSGLLPEEKARVLMELQKEGPIAMVGDGVNDAPAMMAATLGVAMGAAGTDVAIETADVILMGDELPKVEYLIRLGRRARRIVRQIVWFSVGWMGFLVVIASVVALPLTLAVVAHEGSTLLVVLNGLRLLRRD
jgi:Cd2+/Zn2+-exporting ATPase